MPSVKEIVADYLKANGYDGIFNETAHCACDLDDLMPCWHNNADECEPGYKVKCGGCDEYSWCIHEDKGYQCETEEDDA